MKMIKLLLPIMLLTVISCTAPTYNLRLESGRPLANPNYVLKDTGDTDMMVTFWFTEFSSVTDLDGSKVFIPHTLEMNDVHSLGKDPQKLTVTVEVWNPKFIKYDITYNVKSEDLNFQMHQLTGVSDLIYRNFTITLPINNKTDQSCLFQGMVNVEGLPLFMMGPFRYRKGG